MSDLLYVNFGLMRCHPTELYTELHFVLNFSNAYCCTCFVFYLFSGVLAEHIQSITQAEAFGKKNRTDGGPLSLLRWRVCEGVGRAWDCPNSWAIPPCFMLNFTAF